MAKTQDKPNPIRFAALVALNLRDIRERLGLTQAQAAAKSGVSFRTWWNWENDPEKSTGASVGGNLDNIARALGVPVTVFLSDHLANLATKPKEKETAHAAKNVRRYARKAAP